MVLLTGICRRLLGLLAVLLPAALGQAQVGVTEYGLKAAFVYQFATYVEWPDAVFESADSPLRFGVIGSELLAGNLEALVRDQRVNGRVPQVLRLQPDEPLTALHVLFVGDQALASTLLAQAPGQPLLTVTETDPALWPAGSMINLQVVDDRVRFDVALMPVTQSGLRLSARLLQVAQRVVQE